MKPNNSKGNPDFASESGIPGQVSVQEKLREGNKYYQQLLDKLPVAAYICDEHGYVQQYNEAATELFGREAERGVDRWCCSWRAYYMDGTPADAENCPMATTLRDGKADPGQQLIIERPNGTRRVVTPYPQRLYNTLGEMIGGMNVVIDITDQKHVEYALKENEKKYQDILSTLPVAIYTTDPDGYITFYNEKAVDLWGRRPQLKKDLWCGSWKIYRPDGTPLPLDSCPMAVALREKRLVAGEEIVVERPDGERRFVAPYPQPIFDSLGNLSGAVNLLTDITEQRVIERSMANLAAIVRSSDDAIISKTLEGIITSWNNAAETIFGYTPEEAIGQHISIIIPPDRIGEEADIIGRLKKGLRIEHFETQRVGKDGKLIDISLTISPMKDSKGNIIGASKIARNITGHRDVERKMANLAAIVQSSDDGIISKTLDGIITSWNNAAERIFGYTEGEVIGKSIAILIPPDRQDEEPKILERLKRGERVDHFETQRMTRDGKLIDISLTISPVRNSKGEIIGASKIARDITAQQQIEKLAQEWEERFRMAVESTRLGIWELSMATNQMVWSTECRKIFAVPDSLEVDYGFFIDHIHEEDVSNVSGRIKHATDPGGNGHLDMEYRIRQYNSERIRWVRTQGKVYFSNTQKPERLLGTVFDITEERMTKEALEQTVQERTRELVKTNEKLTKSNSDLEQFAYIASHDLQEPLRKIRTFTELLRKSVNDPANFQMYYEKINSSAQRMSVLITDVLNYSRVSRVVYELVNVDLNELLHTARTDFELLIEQKGAIVKADKLPVIKGHPAQLQQLFANLLSNALKFSKDKPEINITCRMLNPEESAKRYRDIAPGYSYVQIEFRDNGIGFSQEYAEKIFMIFQQLNSPHAYSGTGIGLALCKKIVENHGGVITACGQEGEGATFTIVLPLK